MLLIIINIRKSKESELSTLMRILTNYLQLLSTSLSFDVQYPRSLTDMFVPVNRVGSSSDTFLSFDCFVTDFEITGPFPSNTFFKLFLMALLPIILFVIISMIWVVVKLIRKQWIPDLKRNIAISFISIIFLLHPTLTENSLSIFQCVEIDDGENKVRIYTEMDCFNSEHISWCFILGFPILVIWVIFTPIFALVMLAVNIKKGDGNKIKQYMLILYQGLKIDRYYWEFVNTLRKVLILMSFSLLITFNPAYRIMVSVIILLITFRVQVGLSPYKKSEYNDVEILAILAGTMTLLSGVVFSTDEDQNTVLNVLILIAVIIFNITYICRWAYLLIVCLSEKYKVFRYMVEAINIIRCTRKFKLGNLSYLISTIYI